MTAERRPHARLLRAAALAELGRAVRSAFSSSRDDEALLYAVAVGLYCPHDPRFRV